MPEAGFSRASEARVILVLLVVLKDRYAGKV